jgi:uncharacterized protein YukE
MMMIKLKNVLNEQEYVAKATNDFFSDNQKKIYEHVLAALAEQLKMTADEVDDHTETDKQFNDALKQIVTTIEKLADRIESTFG